MSWAYLPSRYERKGLSDRSGSVPSAMAPYLRTRGGNDYLLGLEKASLERLRARRDTERKIPVAGERSKQMFKNTDFDDAVKAAMLENLVVSLGLDRLAGQWIDKCAEALANGEEPPCPPDSIRMVNHTFGLVPNDARAEANIVLLTAETDAPENPSGTFRGDDADISLVKPDLDPDGTERDFAESAD